MVIIISVQFSLYSAKLLVGHKTEEPAANKEKPKAVIAPLIIYF